MRNPDRAGKTGAGQTRDETRRGSLFEVMTLAALSTFGILAMLPTADEKVAALIADREYPEAIAALEHRGGTQALSEYNAFSLAILYRRTGQVERAALMLEDMLANSPESMPVLNELADIYRSQSREADEMRVLLQAFAVAPSPAIQDRLFALRDNGDLSSPFGDALASRSVSLVKTAAADPLHKTTSDREIKR